MHRLQCFLLALTISLLLHGLVVLGRVSGSRYSPKGDEVVGNDGQTEEGEASPSSFGKARILYLIGIHDERTLEDAVPLFRAVRHRRNIVLVHIDQKFGLDGYEGSTLQHEILENERSIGSAAVVEVHSLFDCEWGQWSMLYPTLWAIQVGTSDRYDNKWDVFVNLSGDTLPVYTGETMASILATPPFSHTNFVTSSSCETGLLPTPVHIFPSRWHKRAHYDRDPPILTWIDPDGTEHEDEHITIYFGSQWMVLQPDFCRYISDSLELPDSLATQLKAWLVGTQKLMADETFVPTLLMHYHTTNPSASPSTLPVLNETDRSLVFKPDSSYSGMHVSAAAGVSKIYAVRYERMDEHVPSAFGKFPTQQHYEVPDSLISTNRVSQVKPWGPYFLGVYDLSRIKQSGALFVRKVSTRIDHNLVRLLPVDHADNIPDISWPMEVSVVPKPNWEAKLQRIKAQLLQEQQSTVQAQSVEHTVETDTTSSESDDEEEADPDSADEDL